MKKTKKFYREELVKGLKQGSAVIKDIVKSYGIKKQWEDWKTKKTHTTYIYYIENDYSWNHRIERLELYHNKICYVSVYWWQGDSTDGEGTIELDIDNIMNSVLYNRDYVIPAEWEDVGGEWGKICRHDPIRITADEIKSLFKNLAKDLEPKK